MVGGMYVPQFKSQKKAEIVFVDPDPAPIDVLLREYGPDTVAQAVRRVSLAKNLVAAGLFHFAAAIMEGAVRDVAPDFLRSANKNELEFAGYRRKDNKFWERTQEYRSYEFDEGSQYLRPIVTTVTNRIPNSLIAFFRGALSVSGGLPSRIIDEWIVETLNDRRRERIVAMDIRETADDREFTRSERKVLGSWDVIEDIANRESQGWTTGMGFEFIVAPLQLGGAY